MRIGLINFTPFTYDADTPYKKPLGGSESGLCYLAAGLAEQGHKVILFGRNRRKKTVRGVTHLPETILGTPVVRQLDILIVQNTPRNGYTLRHLLNPEAKLIFWTGHKTEESAVHSLQMPEIANSYDAIVFVSDWQKATYLNKFPLDPAKCHVIKNFVSPGFENMFSRNQKILNAKPKSPTLAYTTIPQRGLDVLLDIFPDLKKRSPDIRLEVYSSMKVYQSEETEQTSKLYVRCKTTDGIKYFGSIPQPQLAKKMKKVSILSYPAIVPETSCIGVMEAMASGCLVVTTNLGALPETAAGFADLVPIGTDRERFCNSYKEALNKAIKKIYSDNTSALEKTLRDEVAYANKNYTLDAKIKEWEGLFGDITGLDF